MRVSSPFRTRARIEIIPLIDIVFFLLASFMMNAPNFFLASSGGVATDPGELCVRRSFCWHFSLNRSCQLKKSLTLSGLKIGSSGRIRTYDQSVNSRPLYH